MPAKIDSNIAGLAIAEEVSLGVLPGVGGADAIWHDQEPNSYSDYGGTISMVSRQPIDPARQNKKGTVTTIDASAGYNTDVTRSNVLRSLMGFLFADAREKPKTRPLVGTQVAITGVTASNKQYAATTGLLPFNRAGYLINASGFTSASNNGLKTVASAAAGNVTVAETLVDEASPPVASHLTVVGFQFPAADVAIAVTGGFPALVSTATDFSTMGLTPGEWIYIGGDNVANRFANNVGYARIKSISVTNLTFDDTTFTPVTEDGTGKTIRVFFGTVIRNEKNPALIKRRSYNIERTLGTSDAGYVQAEYLEGSIANQFTLNIPNSDKLTADVSFISLDNRQRTGGPGDERKPGTHIATLNQDAINTSQDLFRFKLAVIDPASSNPNSLFGFVSEGSLGIDNGVQPLKALGRLGAFETSTGNFGVSGSVTAYFSTVEAVKAVRNNADVGLSAIFASKNAGQIFDVPLVGLGNGRLNVEKDAPIMLPLDTAGAENVLGYTLMYVNFSYLPTVAMPQ